MAHLEKDILKGKFGHNKKLKAEAKEELREVAEKPKHESHEAKELLRKAKSKALKSKVDN